MTQHFPLRTLAGTVAAAIAVIAAKQFLKPSAAKAERELVAA